MSKRLFIQFYNANGGDSLTLPINPESIDIPTEKEVETHKILNYGEAPVSGYKKLKTISLTSLLPSDSSYFAFLSSLIEKLDYKVYEKAKSVRMIEEWVEAGKPVRVIIAGDAYDEINAEFLLQKFNKNIKETTSDITGTIDLIEYKSPVDNQRKYDDNRGELGKLVSNKIVKLTPRPIRKYISSTRTTKTGETLYKIAKKVYGEASTRSKELAQLNGIFDRNKDLNGAIIEMLPLDRLKAYYD